MTIISIISNTCSILGLIALTSGLVPSLRKSQNYLFLLGNLLMLAGSYLAQNTIYTSNATLCTIASMLAFTSLNNKFRILIIGIFTLGLIEYLLFTKQINSIGTSVGTLSLGLMAFGYATSSNLVLFLGSSGIITFSIIYFINSPNLLAVIYLILNVIFALFALRAFLLEKNK
jgi:hypothetical protein